MNQQLRRNNMMWSADVWNVIFRSTKFVGLAFVQYAVIWCLCVTLVVKGILHSVNIIVVVIFPGSIVTLPF